MLVAICGVSAGKIKIAADGGIVNPVVFFPGLRYPSRCSCNNTLNSVCFLSSIVHLLGRREDSCKISTSNPHNSSFLLLLPTSGEIEIFLRNWVDWELLPLRSADGASVSF